MTILRILVTLVVGASATATAILLRWPGWCYAPLGVVFAVALIYGIAACRREPGPSRTDAVMVLLAIALAVVTTTTAVVGVRGPDRDVVDPTVTTIAAATVRALFTFAPGDYLAEAAQRRLEMLDRKSTRLNSSHPV